MKKPYSSKRSSYQIDFSHLPEEEQWKECMHLLNTKYTLTTKDICQLLKISRSYFTQYIKLPYIYLSKGYYQKEGVLIHKQDYTQLAQHYLIDPDRELTASNYYAESDLLNLLSQSLISITRRTALIPIELLIQPQKLPNFRKDYESISKILQTTSSSVEQVNCSTEAKALSLLQTQAMKEERIDRLEKRKQLLNSSATPLGLKILNDLPNQNDRTASKDIPCTLEGYPSKPQEEVEGEKKGEALPLTLSLIEELTPVYHIKTYGDTDEQIYRDLFNQGSIKVQFQFTKENKDSVKTYYLNPQVQPSKIEHILIKASYLSDLNIQY